MPDIIAGSPQPLPDPSPPASSSTEVAARRRRAPSLPPSLLLHSRHPAPACAELLDSGRLLVVTLARARECPLPLTLAPPRLARPATMKLGRPWPRRRFPPSEAPSRQATSMLQPSSSRTMKFSPSAAKIHVLFLHHAFLLTNLRTPHHDATCELSPHLSHLPHIRAPSSLRSIAPSSSHDAGRAPPRIAMLRPSPRQWRAPSPPHVFTTYHQPAVYRNYSDHPPRSLRVARRHAPRWHPPSLLDTNRCATPRNRADRAPPSLAAPPLIRRIAAHRPAGWFPWHRRWSAPPTPMCHHVMPCGSDGSDPTRPGDPTTRRPDNLKALFPHASEVTRQ